MDFISFNKYKHGEELRTNIMLGYKVTLEGRAGSIDIVKKYMDSFCKEGAKCTILDYEFSIGTRNTKPVYCSTTQYGP